MKVLQRFSMGFGSLVLLAVSLQLFAPKAVHAIVSTLVTVANTTTNPVPIDADADTRNTVVLSATLFSGFSANDQLATQFSDVTNNVTPYVVPTGQRLVIDDVSADVQTTDGAPLLSLSPQLTPTGGAAEFFAPGVSYIVYIPLTQNLQFTNITHYIAHEKTRLVVGPGAILQSSEIGQVAGAHVTVIGHLVDCYSGCNNF